MSQVTHVAYKDITVRRKPGFWWLDRIEDALIRTAPQLYDDVVVITSICDGKHGRGSLHPRDRAEDVRILGERTGGIRVHPNLAALEMPAQQKLAANVWARQLRRNLGSDFDVIVEADHIHIEYDPQ